MWNHEAGPATRFTAIQIKQRYPGHARQALHIAASCQGGAYAGKWTVVVDEDIDAGDLDQVLWAMCTRFDPLTDIDIIQKAWASKRDPLFLPGNFNNRILIDACIPYDKKLKGTFPITVDVSADLRKKLRAKFPQLFAKSWIVMHLIRPASTCVAYGVGAVRRRVRHRPARPRRRGRGLLQGQDRLPRHRLQRRRRLRSYGRLLARHLGKHIPGQPNVVPQNMTGAGSLQGRQLPLFRGAQGRRGDRHVLAQPGHRAAAWQRREFDSTKFTWIGSVTDEVSLCVTWHDLAGEDLERFPRQAVDLRRRGRRAPIPTSSRCSTRTCSAPRSSW